MPIYSCCQIKITEIEINTIKTVIPYNLSKQIPFVGLKDKNGTLIYFGDVLKDDYNNLLTPVCEVFNDEHILYFKPIMHLDKKFGIGCKSTYSRTLEVVGKLETFLETIKNKQ